MPVVAALRPLLAEALSEHGPFVLHVVALACLLALVVELSLRRLLGDR